MRKVNKMLMATVSILLCLVLISTSVVSGIYAKFVVTKSGDATVSLKAFGITLIFEQGKNQPAGATVSATPLDDNTISLRVENIKMIPPQNENTNSYDELIKFVINGTPTVSKVKLKLTVDFEGVENFNIPDNTVIDANHTITTGGNYLPFSLRARVGAGGVNVLDFWRSPASNDALEVAFVNAVRNYSQFEPKFSEDADPTDNSIEAIIWDSTSKKLSISSMGFGYRVHINSSTLRAQGAHPTSDLEADAMYTYLANKTPAPTFSATYTVSIEQVID